MSAFNLTHFTSDLIPAVNALANRLNQTLTRHAYDILAAIDDTEYAYPPAESYYVADLYHFAQNVKEHVPNFQVQTAAQSIMDSTDAAQIAEWHGSAHSNYHGLSIYLPPTEDAYHSRTMLYTLDNFHWVRNTLWDDFLRALFITHAPGIRSRESLSDISFTPFDSNADDYFDAIHVTLDADTTTQTLNITVHGRLIDPSNNTVDTDTSNWTITSNEDEWHNLTLYMPIGGEEGYYDIELILYDEYGIYEDYRRSSDAAYLPEEMQHDVSVNGASITKTVVGHGFPEKINVTIEDKGHYPETVNVTAFANGIAINTTQLTLMSESSITFTISWDTGGQPKGNYTIAVFAEPVDGEANTTNNNLNISIGLIITTPGDVDGDRDVDIFDIVQIAGSYGSNEGDSAYIPNNDIDSDGKTDIFDIVRAAGHYGESW